MTLRKRLTGMLLASVALAGSVLAWTGPVHAAAAVQQAAPAATVAAGPAAAICGLRSVGTRGVYHNCQDTSRRILVTKILTANETFCVLPHADWDVGQWNNIYAAYDEGPC